MTIFLNLSVVVLVCCLFFLPIKKVPVEELARVVIAALQAEPALQSGDAGPAATLVLAQSCPCTE